MVAEEKFREDLLARLGLLPLSIPPLRTRREDLGLLIRRILQEAPGGLEQVELEVEALRLLLLHPWPLNVRELRRILLAGVDLASDEAGGKVTLGPQHLPLSPAPGPPPAPRAPRVSTSPPLELSVDDQELRDRIVLLLGEQQGNVAAVARVLGKPRTQLQRLMVRLGVDRKTR